MPRSNAGAVTVANSFAARTTISSSSVNENFTDIADVVEDCLDTSGRNAMTAQLRAAVGSVAAPGISFDADRDSGLAVVSSRVHAVKDGVTAISYDSDDVAVALPASFAEAVTMASTLNVTGAFTASNVVLPGIVQEYMGITAPAGYLFCYGQAVSRTTYAALFAAVTATATATTNGTTALSSVSVDLTGLGLEGAVIEGSGITPGTTIVSLTADTITLSGAASGSATGVAIRVLPWGAGDGSTTFNIIDKRGRVSAGRDNMGGTSANRLTDQTGGLNGDVLGDTGGSETHTLTSAQIAAHTHTTASQVVVPRDGWGVSGGNFGTPTSGRLVVGSGNEEVSESLESLRQPFGDLTVSLTGSTASGSAGSDGAHNNVQPTISANFIVKT